MAGIDTVKQLEERTRGYKGKLNRLPPQNYEKSYGRIRGWLQSLDPDVEMI